MIGVGNPLRGDDAIGGLAAKALKAKRPPNVRVTEIQGEATQVLEAWVGAADVIVIDACRSGAPAGTIHRFDAARSPLPANSGGVSSHGFGLTAALELARTFEQLPRRCVVLAMEGEDFSHDAPLSARVAARLDDLVARVEQEIEHMRHESAS